MAAVVARVMLVALGAAAALSAAPQGRPQAAGPAPAYLLVELPSGQVVSESGRRILDTPVAPGSIAKLATLAAVLESGVAHDGTRIMCRRRADVDGRTIECVHPELRRPLDPAEALGFSCNVYFATVARRLERGRLNQALTSLGLPPLDAGTPVVTGALGLDGIRATPRQLLEAFLRVAGASKTAIGLTAAQMGVLRRGMELAARTGTASALADAGFSGLAKTGTAPMPGGGYEGLVVALVNTELPTHAIVVVAPGASGADAARLAAGILRKHGAPTRRTDESNAWRVPAPAAVAAQRRSSVIPYRVVIPGPRSGTRNPVVDSRFRGNDVNGPASAGMTSWDSTPAYSNRQPRPGSSVILGPGAPPEALAFPSPRVSAVRHPGPGARIPGPDEDHGPVPSGRQLRPGSSPPGESGSQSIKIGIARAGGSYAVETMELESYVARAVAGEGGDELPAAALEALAITVRTWAEANRGRHADEGFDVCDLTHCLSLRAPTTKSRAAVASTSGLRLYDGTELAEVYLSASCGGHTEKPSMVWRGARDPRHLPTQPDSVCARESGWVTEIPEPRLRQALLAAGLRGGPVRDLRVVARAPSGRARHLAVDGMVPEVVDAGAFRLAAGRVLGWQTIKSTLFQIERVAIGYRLTGRGMGHGVGLCVRGAAARAARSDSRDAILAFYFPGLRIGSASADIRVVLPEADRDSLPAIRRSASAAMTELAGKLGVPEPALVEIRFHPTVEAYTRATGQPWWTAAATAGARIDLLPLDVLRRRGILDRTMRHEVVHVLTAGTLASRPLWVREGLAAVMAGDELPAASAAVPACPSDAELRASGDPDAWRDAYARAARCVAAALARGESWRDLR